MRKNKDDVPDYDGQPIFKGDFREADDKDSALMKVYKWVSDL